MKKTWTVLLALLALSANVWASDIEVQSPWVRGTVPGQKATGAFMTLTSKAGATLIGASVDKATADLVEVHEMKMDGDRMLMRAIPRLPLPAGQAVDLSSGTYHIMLMGLKQQLKAGDSVDLELKIETAGKKIEVVKVKASVRDLTSSPAGNDAHMHMH